MEGLWEGGRPDRLAVGTSNQPSTNRCASDILPLLYSFVVALELMILNPELIICRSPYVKCCAMFGSNRPWVGVLIEPDGDNAEIFDPAEVDLLARFRNFVW
jgi:hypothetical protein